LFASHVSQFTGQTTAASNALMDKIASPAPVQAVNRCRRLGQERVSIFISSLEDLFISMTHVGGQAQSPFSIAEIRFACRWHLGVPRLVGGEFRTSPSHGQQHKRTCFAR